MPERAARASAERRATGNSRRPPRPVLVASDGEMTRAAVRGAGGAAPRDQSPTGARGPAQRSAALAVSGNGVPGRRTVVIRGQVADRYEPRRRSQRSGGATARYYRPGPDRAAKWAVLLGFLLVIVALASAHI
jgi:hypothetical protein